jgi:hypothetical protein
MHFPLTILAQVATDSPVASLLFVPELLPAKGGSLLCGHWNGRVSALTLRGQLLATNHGSAQPVIGQWVSGLMRMPPNLASTGT